MLRRLKASVAAIGPSGKINEPSIASKGICPEEARSLCRRGPCVDRNYIRLVALEWEPMYEAREAELECSRFRSVTTLW